MSQYLIEFTNQAATVLFTYDTAGFLIKYDLTPGTFEQVHFEYLISRFPKRLELLQRWIDQKVPNTKIRKVEDDLSFSRFYELYDNKLGKKSKAMSIWEDLPDVEKAKAIAFIPAYNSQLMQTGYAKKYCETYLIQETWNN